MTLPAQPFAEIDVDPSLFDATRTRARRRRRRSAGIGTTALALVITAGGLVVAQPLSNRTLPADGVKHQEPWRPFDKRTPFRHDQDLAALATGCDATCSSQFDVAYEDGYELGLVTRDLHPVAWVLARDGKKVDEIDDASDVTTASSLSMPHPGIAVFSGKDGDTEVVVPVGVRGEQIVLPNGGFGQRTITNEFRFPVVDAGNDPTTFEHALLGAHRTSGGWSYTRWRWNGDRYYGDSCQPDFEKVGDDNGQPPCFSRTYPSFPAWTEQVDCDHEDCWVRGPVALPSGDKLAALYADMPVKLALLRGDTLLDVLPGPDFGSGIPIALEVDKTGHALLQLTDHASTRSWVVPVAEADGKLQVLQGGFGISEAAFLGQQGAAIKDVDGDGTDEIMTKSDGVVTTYRWDGTQYVATGPARPTWTSAVPDCTHLCVERQQLDVGNGETLSVLTGQVGGAYKLALHRGDAVLASAPATGNGSGFTTHFAAGYVQNLVRDGDRFLVVVSGSPMSRSVVPYSSTLQLLQGPPDDPDMRGDTTTTATSDGVQVGEHDGDRTSVTTWRWNGTAYAPTSCVGDLC